MGIARKWSANANATGGASPRSLSPKQVRFVEKYLVDLNGKQAAIRSGRSERTAERQASRLLNNAKVQDAVEAAREARSVRTQINSDRVLLELVRIGFSDLRHAFTAEGEPKPLSATLYSLHLFFRDANKRSDMKNADLTVSDHVPNCALRATPALGKRRRCERRRGIPEAAIRRLHNLDRARRSSVRIASGRDGAAL